MYHVKRKDKEITDPSLLKRILKQAKYVTIALASNNQPYLISLSHGYDEDRECIYFHCAKEGKKLDFLKSNNTIWGQALLDFGYSEGKCDQLFASVHFQGRVTFIDDPEEKRRAAECMLRQLDMNSETSISRLQNIEPERLKATTFGRISIDYMSGKKSTEVNL